MIKNYFRIAFRNLLKNQSYVIINTLGLGLALACCITAYLLLAYNIEFDSFHADEKVEKVFKVHTYIKEKDGKIIQQIMSPMPLAPAIAQDITGVERFTRFINGGGFMRYGDKAFSEGMAFADSTFFDMFDFPFEKGNQKSFKDKYSIIISQKVAKKYFGDEDPVGKMMVMNFANQKEIEVMVGGVLKKVPLNNSFYFDVMMRIENFLDINLLTIDDWKDWRDPAIFVSLASVQNAEAMTKQFKRYVATRNEARKDANVDSYHLEPFKASFTQDEIRGGSQVNMRIGMAPLIIFTSMAILILLIACFNLTNTSIAMTGKRLKEVGVRKVVGATRAQVVSQFLFETVITILLALIAGYCLSKLIVPAFTTMWNLSYGMEDLSGLNLVIALITLVFVASLLAGIYPALFNSKFKPVVLLKGNIRVKGTNMLTRILVAVQFALCVVLLLAGVMFIRNTAFHEAIKFGYDKDMVVTVNIQNENEFTAMESKILSNPKIMKVAVSDHNIGYSTYKFPVQIDTTKYEAQLIGVGKNYFETMGLKFAEGRPLNIDITSDMEGAIVVNQAFLVKTGITDPLEKVVTVHDKKRHIVGVIENHIDNLYRSKEPEPFVFYMSEPKYYKLLLVRAEANDLGDTQKYLERTWKELFPTKPFESQFQNDIVLKDTKETGANLEKIFLFLTVLGGLLSASGIFSLASLNIAKRTKEIGIRKTLGAKLSNIVALLNKEFVIILSISGVLGAVGGYFATDAMLAEIYAYHISVGMIPVILCALAIFAIGIITTSITILRAAKANPVDTLRNE
jgi:putative ABC transport system permease protein